MQFTRVLSVWRARLTIMNQEWQVSWTLVRTVTMWLKILAIHSPRQGWMMELSYTKEFEVKTFSNDLKLLRFHWKLNLKLQDYVPGGLHKKKLKRMWKLSSFVGLSCDPSEGGDKLDMPRTLYSFLKCKQFHKLDIFNLFRMIMYWLCKNDSCETCANLIGSLLRTISKHNYFDVC